MSKTIVAKLKEEQEDFEWYPTTNAMLSVVKTDILMRLGDNGLNILDCGAGDGRALRRISSDKDDLYAIEKSKVLIDLMPSDIFIISTEFYGSTLIDKKVDVLFCNPPYSDYAGWAEKIILEANAKMVYLIIPKRWKNVEAISNAVKQRDASVKIIGSLDFLNAERKARAEIDILAIKLYTSAAGWRDRVKADPFETWFDMEFGFDTCGEKDFSEDKEKFKDTVQNALILGANLIEALVQLYGEELKMLHENYKAVSKLNPKILKELNVDIDAIKAGLKQKIEGLKYRYWGELFDNCQKITIRLTVSSRKKLMDVLLKNTSVDFTESNIYAVVVWAVKNANKYFDTQLVGLVEDVVSKANIKLYKSNKRVFQDDEWAYCQKPDGLNKYSLEHRIVMHNKSGVARGDYGYNWDYVNGLYKGAHDFLSDICTVANNLGFQCNDGSKEFNWSSGKKYLFMLGDTDVPLMEVKAFKNRNIHIKFNTDFIKKLNIEFGRLKGWLKDKQEASKELSIPLEEVGVAFGTNYRLDKQNVSLLT